MKRKLSRRLDPKKTVKRKFILDPIHHFEFLLVTGPSQKKAIQLYCKLFKVAEPNFEDPKFSQGEHQGGAFITSGVKAGLFWFPVHTPGAPVVSHEVLHAVFYALRILKWDLNSEYGDEPACYYTEWLTREIGREVWNR